MQRRVLTAAVGLVLTLSLTPFATACQSADANGRDDSAPGTADGTGEGSSGVPPGPPGSSGASGASGGAGSPGASSAAVAPNASAPFGAKGGKPSGGSSDAPPGAPSGLPPQPDTASRAAYAAALDAIDPRIVGGDPADAVERGRTTCQAIAAHMNHTKLITQTKQKFARPGYTVTNSQAEAIVRAANTHLCPSSGA